MKTKTICCLFLVTSMILMTDVIWAYDRYVSTSGTDVNIFFCTSSWSPCRTIQQALDNAIDGETIKVAVGTYDENVEIHKAISDLRVEGGWNSDFTTQNGDPSKTTIHGLPGAGKRTILIVPDASNEISLTFKNFSITGGTNGAILAASPSGSVLAAFENNVIFENTYLVFPADGIVANSYGTGATTLTLKKNRIYNNTLGGLIYAESTACETTVNLEDNVIVQNASFHGIGARSINNGIVNLNTTNNIVSNSDDTWEMMYLTVHNQAQLLINSTNDTMIHDPLGSGKSFAYLYSFNDAMIEINIYNSIWWNDGSDALGSGPAIVAEGDCSVPGPASSVKITVNYSNIGGEVIQYSECFSTPTVIESSNININPKLNNKLHLSPRSPCIDAGRCGSYLLGAYYRIAPYSDIDGDLRPEYGVIFGCDMGADEYVPMVMPWVFLLTDLWAP